eukprot:scaffold4151_cov106-Isochrysis_galbana.AAC.5
MDSGRPSRESLGRMRWSEIWISTCARCEPNQEKKTPGMVASGVDAAAILAVAVVIDEDHDESDAKKERKKAEQSGGWSPFG